jgi:hypothetical protein
MFRMHEKKEKKKFSSSNENIWCLGFRFSLWFVEILATAKGLLSGNYTFKKHNN